MGPFERVKTILGLLVVGAALLLASPGVHVVPAQAEEPVSTEEPGPQCSAQQQPGADAEIRALLAKLRQEQMARTGTDADGPVALDGRGHNYGPPPEIELDRLQAESQQTPSR